MTDLIDRQAAIDVMQLAIEDDWEYDYAIDRLSEVPSAQPELDEWCTDCKEYDKEHHRCPRWNRVIRHTIDDLKTKQSVPSAQPEIIRCGECRWFQCNMRMDGYLPKGVSEFECRHWCGSCDPVDFCSHAERKTDE